jgi:hypothetical protein
MPGRAWPRRARVRLSQPSERVCAASNHNGVVQEARNLLTDLDDSANAMKFVLHDRRP